MKFNWSDFSKSGDFEATIIHSIKSTRKTSLFLEKWPLTTTASILLYFQAHYWWAGRNSIVFCCCSQYYCRGKRSVKTRLEKVALKKMAKKGSFINYVNMILKIFDRLRWPLFGKSRHVEKRPLELLLFLNLPQDVL